MCYYKFDVKKKKTKREIFSLLFQKEINIKIENRK